MFRRANLSTYFPTGALHSPATIFTILAVGNPPQHSRYWSTRCGTGRGNGDAGYRATVQFRLSFFGTALSAIPVCQKRPCFTHSFKHWLKSRLKLCKR